jgi:formate dehydrogenase subunit gamma
MNRLLRLVALLTLATGLGFAAPPALAQVGSNAASDRGVYQNPTQAPTDDEAALLRTLRSGQMPDGQVRGNVYIPDRKASILVQPEGRTWRDFRVGPSRWVHAGMLALSILAVIVLAVARGSADYQRDPLGRRILRFRAVDRFVHWLTAVSFVLLALSGLNFVFGRIVLQPLIGDGAFSTLTQWGLFTHNYVGYAFLVGVLTMAVLWFRDNLFRRIDRLWFRRGGGLFSGEHIPAEKFNAGQKLIYWIAVLGGLALGVTGVIMMLPIGTVGVGGMQWLQGIHTLVAAAMIAVIIGHIYLGSWGVQGSFEAMTRGDVDLEWARTHHPLWADRKLGSPLGPDGSVIRPGPAE